MNKKPAGDTNTKRVAPLIKRWGRLKSGERAVLIALIGAIAMTCSAVVGGLLAVLAGVAPDIAQGNVPAPPNELIMADWRLDDWSLGTLYGFPAGSAPIDPDNYLDWESRRETIYDRGFHVMYADGDFNSLEARLPQGSVIPDSLVGTDKSHPVVPMDFEVWNLSRSEPAVIEGISIELLEHIPPPQANFDLYYFDAPAPGGGGDLPAREFDATLFSESSKIDLLRGAFSRIRLDPGEPVLIKLNVGFMDPGKYRLLVSIIYHFPDGSTKPISVPGLVYGWIHVPYVDGAEVTIAR